MTDNLNTPLVKATEADLQSSAGTTTAGTTTAGTTTTETRMLSGAGLGTQSEQDQMKVELLAEQVAVQKQERQLGEVQISKRVVEEKVMVPVTLRREEVTMTRNKIEADANQPVARGNPTSAQSSQAMAQADQALARSGEAFKDETFTITLYEEVPVITKTTRVSEVIEVQKRVLTEEKTITESVRHEEANIDEGTTGRVTIEGDTSKNGL